MAIANGFDGWVALDTGAERIIVAVIEVKMCHCCLCGDMWISHRIDKSQFLGCGKVCHMEMSIILASQFYSETGTLVARFFTAYLWMMCHFGVRPIKALCLRHVAVNDLRIFTMCHQGQR
ncbi:hypothetical protein N184_37755 [Sinorhizobium sp. GL28]|nr:hypothetical protein N184_37755 [Sinorhizobium sp. GL28]